MSQQLSEFELAERREAFNGWFRRWSEHNGYHQLPSQHQGVVHDMVRRAFYGGANWERKKNEPIQLGGYKD